MNHRCSLVGSAGVALLPALLAALLATTGLAQENTGAKDTRPVPAPKPVFVPHSLRLGLDLDGLAPRLELEAPDLELVLAQDEEDAASGSKSVRYGIGRDLYADLDFGDWHVLSDGSTVWALDLVSRGAMGLRVHLANLDLPKGSELYVYSRPSATSGKDVPLIVAGPYTQDDMARLREVWTPTRDGQRVRVEFRRSAESAAEPMVDEPFTIDRIQHIYRDPMKGIAGGPLGAGPCHNDVSCFAAWNNVRSAVAGIGTTGANSLWCTGTLLNPSNSDQTPYWLTANHCLATNAEANNAEIYWLYNSSTCGGSVPSLFSVPQSANCTVLATSSNSDFTLLMINGELPNGLFWAGWTASAVANGTASACVHHPAGDFKRISFGDKANAPGAFVQVNWTDGPTEPGSSGSGIFRSDTQQLYGQLCCGTSACGFETNDDFGDFSVTFNSISSLLPAGSDDALEPNDSCAGAAALATSNNNGLIVKSTDEDWYTFTLNPGGSVAASFDFVDVFGDIDVTLQQGCGGPIVASSESGTNDEAINFTNNTGSVQTYFMRVWLFSDTRAEYDMDVTITGGGGGGPVNDACSSATVIGNGSFSGTLVGATNDGNASCGSSSSSADVWYSYTASCTGILDIDTCGTNDLGTQDLGVDSVLSVYSGCPGTTGNELACNDDWAGGECAGLDNGFTRDSAVSLNVTAGQNVLIRVSHFSTTQTGPFNLNVSCTSTGPAADDCVAAVPVADGTTMGTLIGATNDGGATCGASALAPDTWFTYTASFDGTLELSTCGTHDLGSLDSGMDTVLSVHSACPGPGAVQLACNDDATGGACAGLDGGGIRDSALSITVSDGQTVWIRVSHWNGSNPSFPGDFFLNVNGIPDSGPTAETEAFCFGNGGVTPGCTDCPCGNDAPAGQDSGCLNSSGFGCFLLVSGIPDPSNDTLRFDISGGSPNSFAALLSADNMLPTMGACPPGSGILGAAALDGLRCIGGGLLRHGSRATNGIGVNTNPWGPPGNPAAGYSALNGWTAGQVRQFQVFYRDFETVGCMTGQNTSNAISVTFGAP